MSGKLMELKSLRAFEKPALENMSENAKLYFAADASDPFTSRPNEKGFSRFRIRPRALRGVSEAKLDCKILGACAKCPIGLAPLGVQAMAHKDAERASSSGCCRADCIFIMSCLSTCPIEEIPIKVRAQSKNEPILWMQVYINNERSETLDLLKRAESAGFSAIVVTVDAVNGGLWKRNMPDSFFDEVAKLYFNVPRLPRLFLDASITFTDLRWVIENTKLPVIVKGILNGEDAVEAVRCGASAIIVSNHGGRLIEKVVSTIDALEEVVEAVKDLGVDVYLDGGVRSGSDVFVALALGAKAVFIGRPAVWGLSVGGEDGVNRVLEILKEETLLIMQLAGASRVEDIEKSMVIKMFPNTNK